MLSILIPVYNYNVLKLVLELHKQCLECKISFEIICQDDASNYFLTQNNEINTLDNCSFFSNEINLGRGPNRNYLASRANFPWLLFLDCDTFPKQSNFIANYLFEIKKNDNPIVFGGILYELKKPVKEQLLRWIYGQKRESLSVEKRKEKPNTKALTSNLLVEKKLFLKYPFDEEIIKYGYEDLYFFTILEINKIKVTHTENPTFHLNLETSSLFLSKTKEALDTLLQLTKKNIPIETKLTKTYALLHKLKLTRLVAVTFKNTYQILEKNLTSKKPSLFVFDLYKIGYFCYLKNK